jgi:hypothetical protein
MRGRKIKKIKKEKLLLEKDTKNKTIYLPFPNFLESKQ